MDEDIQTYFDSLTQESEGYKTLMLVIYCFECHSHFEINPQALIMAGLMNPSMHAFMRYIRMGECQKCKVKGNL
jgi:hypothetical protein